MTMHARIAIVSLTLSLASPLHAQADKPSKADSVELIRLENRWATGLVKRDRAMFEHLLSKEFVYTEDDRLMQRAEVIEGLTAASDTVAAAHNEGMQVHQFNASSAAVTGWLIVKGRSKGVAFSHRYRFTDTWVKRKGGWQIVAAQDYLVPRK